MSWSTSNRRQELPADWAKIRTRVLVRDGNRCMHVHSDGKRCHGKATDVDHINPGDDHSEANLRALCGWHHRRKSSSEGGTAQQSNRKTHESNFRRTEEHPGLL